MFCRARSYLPYSVKNNSVVNGLRAARPVGRAVLLLAVLTPALWGAGRSYIAGIRDRPSTSSSFSFEQAGRAAGTLWQCPLHRSLTSYR
jgi:hypothetical protein